MTTTRVRYDAPITSRSRYDTHLTSDYKEDKKRGKNDKPWLSLSSQKRDNYQQLSRELIALGRRADAEDMLETVEEIGELRTRSAVRAQKRQDYRTHAAYVTLDKAIDAYRQGRLKEKQFNDIFYRTQHRLSDALHESTAKELKKKPLHRLSLTDIVHKELKQAAAILLFALGIFSLDQGRVTGMAVSSVSGSPDYYSLFGFLLLGLAVFIFYRKH